MESVVVKFSLYKYCDCFLVNCWVFYWINFKISDEWDNSFGDL